MRRIEYAQILWRDSEIKQCLYALAIGLTIMIIVQILLIKPKHDQIEMLRGEISHLQQFDKQIKQKNKALEHVRGKMKPCLWQKEEYQWRMTDDFQTVYDCLMNESSQSIIHWMRLSKHHMGVSLMLGWKEIPA